MKRLTVLRHAKSAWPAGVADHQRPLATRGNRDAPAAGAYLAAGEPIDHVICSTALRTRQTWSHISAAFATVPPVSYEAAVYEATLADLLGVLMNTPPSVGHLLLIGHNPGCEELVLHLAAGPAALRDRVIVKFPTSAIAVLELAAGEELAKGNAQLIDVAVPRG